MHLYNLVIFLYLYNLLEICMLHTVITNAKGFAPWLCSKLIFEKQLEGLGILFVLPSCHLRKSTEPKYHTNRLST